MDHKRLLIGLVCIITVLSGCLPIQPVADPMMMPTAAIEGLPTPTPMPTRPLYAPGTLVDYIAQTGDTLPALAARFNTTESEIRIANPVIPQDATTMPAGFPMRIPIYYESLWGSSFQILPDSLYINGPQQVGFSTVNYLADKSSWLNSFIGYAAGKNRTGAEIIDYVATVYSVSPRLLLALLDYQTGSVLSENPPGATDGYTLGYREAYHRGLYLQLVWAANKLNDAYYGWRTGRLDQIDFPDSRLIHPDPWVNASTVALQALFAELSPDASAFDHAIGPSGYIDTYTQLFGDPWQIASDHIPGSLTQPAMSLPFGQGKTWSFTGGPHTGWGTGNPFAAIDFAPPAVVGGCSPTDEWVTAVADGVIARVDEAVAVLDLDGDGDERTGWVVFYLHLATNEKVAAGTVVTRGQSIGHPSCEGGVSTGTHVHIARKYNGEWIPAAGPLAFNLEGWIASNGAESYLGTLSRAGRRVEACVCSNRDSQITAGIP